MKTSLSHLPPENQSEILQIAEVIKEAIYHKSAADQDVKI